MSSFIGDIASLGATNASRAEEKGVKVKKDNSALEMTDFLMLMVAQFQNQSIDQTADTSDMLNQMVQMQMITALTNMTDATVTMYAGSLVGKEVTIGQFNGEKLEEIVGTVTGTGVSGGEQVIFVNGKSYYLSDIMAVGRLPEKVEETEKPEQPDDGKDEAKDPTTPQV